MTGNTILLHFQVDPSIITNEQKSKTELSEVMKKYISKLSQVSSLQMGDGHLTLYTGDMDSFVTVRAFIEGTISVNIEYPRKGRELLDYERANKMANEIAAVVHSTNFQNFPTLDRSSNFKYNDTTDARFMEYDIDKVVFKEKSPYQEVVIAHSASYGNMLFLDESINHSSTDLIYTETLMQKGKENYREKDILILGGGDGSILCELLKENPKHVLMIDIDEVVIRACRLHLSEVHGGVLDKMKGPNYEIIIGDCVYHLNKLQKEGKKFDYVFGCLSDTPYNEKRAGVEDFIKMVLNAALKVMKPSSKYMCHCDGIVGRKHLARFESDLQQLDEPVDFSTDMTYVPSFLEFWQFYQIRKRNPK